MLRSKPLSVAWMEFTTVWPSNSTALISATTEARIMTGTVGLRRMEPSNTITSGTRELREYGYLRLDRITDERGQVTEWRYAVCDPGPGFPDPENRDGDRPQRPDPENRDIEKELTSSLREEEQDSSKYSRARADDSGTSPLPDDWEPTDRHRTKCSTLGLDVDRLAAEMRQWAYAKNVRRKSWNATFNSFIARAKPKPTKATHVPTETWDNL